MQKKRKSKKSKGKEPEATFAEAPPSLEVTLGGTEQAQKLSTDITPASKKRKAPSEFEEDPENVIVKIPHGATAISDPSSLSKFIKGLLLEEDEQRLTELGPSETSKKISALSYQVMECGLFMQEFAETSQRRMRELEKANTALRREVSEMKTGLDASERKVKKVEKELRESQATLKMEREVSESTVAAYKEVADNLMMERNDLKKEKDVLTEQLEAIAFEAMLKERCHLMKEFLAGEHVAWRPKRWVKEYEKFEAGESISEEDDGEDRGEEVSTKGVAADDVTMEVEAPVDTEPGLQSTGGEGTSETIIDNRVESDVISSVVEAPPPSVDPHVEIMPTEDDN